MYKNKYSPEEKVRLVNLILNNKQNINALATSCGITYTTLAGWVRNYQSIGIDAFYTKGWTKRTSAEKESAVRSYLAGEGSISDICRKFKISDTKTLRQWIIKYTGHEKLKSSGSGGKNIMTKGRKTSFEERVEIVQYCISNNYNYIETSQRFKISYQQARNYVVKYENQGIDALQDCRGKRKSEDQMTELQRLRLEMKILRAEKEQAQMELSFLKKLEEIERRRN
ncbi:MAG: helix-turn-helix domain-containing protein [Cellulosilyticaceae bacterium]